MSDIVTHQLRRVLGSTVAVDGVNLTIESGELFFLLGPSGCGKSTLLNLIAGLDTPDAGRVLFSGRDVTALPTEKRNAVMCFQSYALFPHLSVEQNVLFGLKARKLDATTQRTRAQQALELVQLAGLAQRKPAELSGGQQQRVALARALAVAPDCLLLDEPLSNLDAKLRHDMRGEIQRVCKAAKHTAIYVTHDQQEALSIADRIAVMNSGKVLQVGTPAELYQQPQCSFVAEFISHANVLHGQVLERGADHWQVQTKLGTLHTLPPSRPLPDHIALSIRPNQLQLLSDSATAERSEKNVFDAELQSCGFLGEATEHWLRISDGGLRLTHTPPLFQSSGRVRVRLRPQDLLLHES